MSERSEIVELYERDMRGFLRHMKLSQRKFCKRYRLNQSLFSNLQHNTCTPTIETIERCYRDMDDEGFFSQRRKEQWLIREARAGHFEKVISMAQQLADENNGRS